MKFLNKMLVTACCLVSVYGYGQQDSVGDQLKINSESCGASCNCARSFTPLGVMTDHIHGKGQWMVSYTYMNMAMRGNQMGPAKASDNKVYETYMMAPDRMTMQMHMAMVMYGVSDRLTLMAMGGYVANDMSMSMDMNMPGMTMPMGDMSMKSSSSGFSDTKLSALYNFSKKESQRIIGSMGIGLPTGTIKATGVTMLGDNQRLPYDMQTGTGSFSLSPDITYVKVWPAVSCGANAGADIKLNNNSLGYRVGNAYHATAWAGYKFLPWVSFSLRAEYTRADKISGSDAAMNASYYQTTDPTTATGNYGGTWVNGYAGLNFHLMKPVLERFILLMEFGMPVYQNLNGVQTALNNTLLAGLQYSLK